MRAKRFFFIAMFAGTWGWSLGPVAPAAVPAKFSPVSRDGELVLFDAAIHDISAIRNYTARWQKGSDLTPIVNPIVKDGRTFAEYTYRGKQGSACSTFWLEDVPAPDKGVVYRGIRFTIDYDKDDFAKVSAKASFSDGTSLDAPLTLEPGCKDYDFTKGFRRAKTPIMWSALNYLWLSASAGGKGNPLRFRLKRIVMIQEKSAHRARALANGISNDADTPDRFGERVFNPRLKQIRWLEGDFPARRHTRLYLARDASARTRRTAALFSEKYHAHTGVNLETQLLAGAYSQDGIVLRVADSANALALGAAYGV